MLPKALLDAGPRELVRKLLAVPGLVPDRTITEMLDDSTCSETFEPLRQPKATRAGTGLAARTSRPAPLVAVTSDADIARKLADLVTPDAATAPIAASPAAPDAGIAPARVERVRTAAQALSDLSGSASRPASDAQLRSLENFLGSVSVDLRAYFGVTAKPGYGLAPTGTETSALSLGEALRETKALRRHGADPGLLEDARAFRGGTRTDALVSGASLHLELTAARAQALDEVLARGCAVSGLVAAASERSGDTRRGGRAPTYAGRGAF